MDSLPARLRLFIFFTAVLVLASCRRDRKVDVTRSYYFWRLGDIHPSEAEFLKTNAIKKLYCHLMDVDWSETLGAIPVAENAVERIDHELKSYDHLAIDIVPVVFITNKTFEHIDPADIDQLALRLVRRCLPSYDNVDQDFERRHDMAWNGGPIRPREIQFDCDWTAGTKEKYFRFLQEVSRLVHGREITVSATIRLHQYKYPEKTGVPPVQRGMLMVYNVSDPRQYSPQNSVFDEGKAEAYFSGAKRYPLPLDMALPAYSWCLVFRDRKFYQIENDLTEEQLQQLSFLERNRNGFYEVKADTTWHDMFFRPGDELKMETIDEKTLEKAADLARKALNTDIMSVSLFELSDNETKNFSRETIDRVYRLYR